MKNEVLTLIEFLEKEYSLDKGTVAEVLEKSIEAVAKKKEELPPIQAHVDTDTGLMVLTSKFTIVPDDYQEVPEEDENGNPVEPENEVGPHITLSAAKKIPSLKGLELDTWIQLDLGECDYDKLFGRIDVQTIKQITFQRLRDAKRDTILREYSDKIGDLVSGQIIKIERGSYTVQLEKTEAIIPRKEQSPVEHFKMGETIRAVVLDVKTGDDSKGPRVILSRATNAMILRLFELEVPEIYDGIVEIKACTREAGFRSKIAVMSHDPKIDPVGSCVGVRGARVRNIVQEIHNEKVDIVRWSEDLETYVREALKPVEILDFYDDGSLAVAVIPDEQHSLALGKNGSNIKLVSRLIGYEIKILTRSEAEEQMREYEASGEEGETGPQPEGESAETSATEEITKE